MTLKDLSATQRVKSTSTPQPFADRASAAYWGGGVVVTATRGGYWSLLGRSTPTGPELGHVGQVDGRPVGGAGWPDDVCGRYVWAQPADGSAIGICRVSA